MAALLRLTTMLGLLMVLAGCTSMMFLPMKPWAQNPARQGLAYEDVVLIHPDGLRLHGWWLPSATREVHGTVFFLHGNAENVSTHLMSVAWMPRAGYQVFLLDYRGYGLSEGKARWPEVMEDIQLGLDWLHGSDRLRPPLVVFGQSLGAALSTAVLARPENRGRFDCAMLEAGFASYRGIADDLMAGSLVLSALAPLVRWSLPDRLDPQDRIGLIEAPLLILHSRQDEVIPFAHGLRLYQKAQPPKAFLELSGRHIGAARDPEVQASMLAYLQGDCVPR